MSNTATGKFYSHSTCKFTDDAVEKIKGSWYIKLGFAGFNSRANDGTIFDTIPTGSAIIGYRVKYEAANTWGLYVRVLGSGWKAVQTNLAYTLTPTHVVFGVSWPDPLERACVSTVGPGRR